MEGLQEFLDREEASWAAFGAQVARVPEDGRETPGVVGEWTLKDVVWHCAYWSRFAAEHLGAANGPVFVDPFDLRPDEDWDAVNAKVAEASSSMGWSGVMNGAEEARAGLREAASRPGLAAAPIAWAADESWIHYDEHAADVRTFADRSGN
jgi:hypothetical protein